MNYYDHECGRSKCTCCQSYVDLKTHKCFIQQIKDKKRKRDDDEESEEAEEEDQFYIYFDIECMQDTGRHEPNLLVAMTSDEDQPHIFEGRSCVKDFCSWLFTPEHRGARVVAHNLQSYDSYFVLQETYKEMLVPKLIMRDSKVLSMNFEQHGITFIDSLSFIPLPLAGFREAFGLSTELEKGDFPHRFNRLENQHYIGPMPELKWYDAESKKKPEASEKLVKWHKNEVKKGTVFNLQEELKKYCINDVAILKEGCQTFIKNMRNILNVDPMADRITIASACSKVYRKFFMPEGTIAVEPRFGWRHMHKHSFISREWLMWKEHETGRRLQRATNGGEARIELRDGTKVLVDGFDAEQGIVYEFHGCFFHGCPKCFNHDQQHKTRGVTYRQLWLDTQARTKALQELNLEVIEIWGCQWDAMKKNCPDVQEFVQQLQLVTPLNARDCFFGGRTNATKLFYDIEQGEKIKYVDFTSLYPSVNKYGWYPVGHPDEFLDHVTHKDISRFFGIAKVTIIPPRFLYHAVLPVRFAGKLIFPLCQTCMETELSKPLHGKTHACPHTDKQRQFTGTWCTPEIEKAVEKGYRIVKIHEVWHFKEKSDQLFRGYIDTFLKLKQQAAGWPVSVGDDETKRQEYIQLYHEAEGIVLDYSEIMENAGLYYLAKIMLNSFWGKFGQARNQTQVEVFTDPAEFYTFLSDYTHAIDALNIINEDMVEVYFKNVEDADEPSNFTNIFVAAFTTCWARLKLYDVLDQVGERVCYFDTDSIVYISREGQHDPPLGNYLGQLTNELKKGKYITEWVSAGPKNYAFKTQDGETKCKVRGFTLNTRGQQKLNFESMKKLVHDEIFQPEHKKRTIVLNEPFKIDRNKATKEIVTKSMNKAYKLVFDKRVVLPNGDSLPYGYS